MKTTLILAVVTILSLGTLALVRAQDEGKESVEPVKATASDVNETTPPVSGIRTDVAVEQKLIGGKAEVTTIPVASVFAEGDQFFVLARGVESDLDFRETEVTLGHTDGLNVEVKTGLFPGDEIITVSVNQLRFPAFGEAPVAVCGVGGCELKACDLKDGETCTSCDSKSKKCGTCPVGTETCGTGTCADGVTCTVDADCDFTITADEFFNGGVEVLVESGPFFGAPGFCSPF